MFQNLSDRAYNLAKVGVEGSNPFARSKISFVRSGHMGYGLFWRYG
jgi:hypothetical protein